MKKQYQTVDSVKAQLKSNFPTNIDVVCKDNLTEEQFKEITHLCIDFGIMVTNDVLRSCVNINKTYPDAYHNYRNKKIDTINISHLNYDNYIAVSYDEFIAFIKGTGVYKTPFRKELAISEDYTAVVTEKDIKVSCQTISFDTVEKLMKLVKEAKKHSSTLAKS